MIGLLYFALFYLKLNIIVDAYIKQDGTPNRTSVYFKPYESGFVGVYGDPNNFQRERINEGSFENPDKELIYEAVPTTQVCPGMVGPFSDGSFYCSAKEYGYCDRRSGVCFCNMGYQGIDCSECSPSYFLVGSLCYPKKNCPDDCSEAGTCNYWTGTCQCLPHRIGENCGTPLCKTFDPLCETCSNSTCLRCSSGYYVTERSTCSSCFDYDPRCAGCTKDLGCTLCADPILTSVRRSGYRASDPRVPIEEDTREFSITLPFGTKSAESFADAEAFVIASTPDKPLKDNSIACHQGESNDASWRCNKFPASHVVCGHKGVFSFTYPNYVINETSRFFRISVVRSGGGYGTVLINYFIKHFTTNDSDVTATAPYTTSQTLEFTDGVVERSFLISILDDNLVEENEVFQIVLEPPEGGGSVGAQFRTNVTIVDDDFDKLSPVFTKPLDTTIAAKASTTFSTSVHAIAASGKYINTGGAVFLAIIENDASMWSGIRGTGQRHSLRTKCMVTDTGNGTYTVEGSVVEQGIYQLRIWHAFPLGLMGTYFSDAFMQNSALSRIDRFVNFTWGTGRLTPRGSDYISIRWVGALRPDTTDIYYLKVEADDLARLWIDGILLIDHWHEQEAYLESYRQVNFTAGVLYEIILEYCEVRGDAYASLKWTTASTNFFEAIPPENMFSLHEIGSSPIEVTITSSATDAQTTECTGQGLYSGVALAQSYFQFCPRDMYRNFRNDDDETFLASEIFNVSLTLVDDLGYDGQGSEILWPVLTYNSQLNCFDAAYTPERAGLYELNIVYMYWHGEVAGHVSGSPFDVNVSPASMNGPYSEVHGLSTPHYAVAGVCFHFLVTARDGSHNLRLKGGDLIQSYIYMIDFFENYAEERNSTEVFDTNFNVVRYGTTYDYKNGSYDIEMCPVISGWYEMHILLNGQGVSNIPRSVNEFSFRGQYIGDSPYRLYVSSGEAASLTSTVEVYGNLLGSIVGVLSSFVVTLRDSWGNVVRKNLYSSLHAYFPSMPNVSVDVQSFYNGSYLLEYTPTLTGQHPIMVQIDGYPISGAPFVVPITDGVTSPNYTFAVGSGLHIGVAGTESSFMVVTYDLRGNRKSDNTDVYGFSTSGSEELSGSLLPCDNSSADSAKYCLSSYGIEGAYFGVFTPTKTGLLNISVFLNSDGQHELSNSPFIATIHPGPPAAGNTDIVGTIHNATVGKKYTIRVQLRDAFNNKLQNGDADLELMLGGVSGNWGTVQPYGYVPGRMNQYFYLGHYANYPDIYGTWTDMQDGSYICTYSLNKTGIYVLRLSVAENGLNATFFNDTSFGYLVDLDDNLRSFDKTRDGKAENMGSTISWTGDIGRRQGLHGTLGEGSYFHRFESITVPSVHFDLSIDDSKNVNNFTLPNNILPVQKKFREDFWSMRYVGLITPQYAETYKFTLVTDSQSSSQLRIGGLGAATNNSLSGLVVATTNASVSSSTGSYHFFDAKMREFVLEYVHGSTSPAKLKLYWESPSTPLSIVPESAFRHWRNISHFNLTANPTDLCSRCSTAFGDALSRASVGKLHSFLVYARDTFGNLRQIGGDRPSVVAIGPNGVGFRGVVTDYGNSTYLVEYYVTQVGIYKLYVSIGCCPAHPNIGVVKEIESIRELLIAESPFFLNVTSAVLTPERCTVRDSSLISVIAGSDNKFDILFRDVHNNPTTIISEDISLSRIEALDALVRFVKVDNGNTYVNNVDTPVEVFDGFATVFFNLTVAGNYLVYVTLNSTRNPTPIIGSPFRITVNPAKGDASTTSVRGIGKWSAHINHLSSFKIFVRDKYLNIVSHGGSIFLMRLVGAYRRDDPASVIIPLCSDNKNGNYNCSYTPITNGSHELRIQLLDSSTNHPGGNGLVGRYFSNADGYDDSTDPNINNPNLFTRIDPVIDFIWPYGSFGDKNYYSEIASRNMQLQLGSKVIWDGFIVAPTSDSYIIKADSINFNVSIYFDDILIFDSTVSSLGCESRSNCLNQSVFLYRNSAYKIRVIATRLSTEINMSNSIIKLKWYTPGFGETIIPKFFLYSTAHSIIYSPFSVAVS